MELGVSPNFQSTHLIILLVIYPMKYHHWIPIFWLWLYALGTESKFPPTKSVSVSPTGANSSRRNPRRLRVRARGRSDRTNGWWYQTTQGSRRWGWWCWEFWRHPRCIATMVPKNLWGEFLQCSITTDWDDCAWYASILQCRCLCPGCEGLGHDQAEVEEVQREELVLPRPSDQDL